MESVVQASRLFPFLWIARRGIAVIHVDTTV